MKVIFISLISIFIFSACSTKEVNQPSYEDQNKHAEKSLKGLNNE